MKLTYFLSAAALLLVLGSCGNETKKTTEEPEVVTVDVNETKEYAAAETKASFKDDKIAGAFDKYIEVKTALVNTDAGTTSKAASQLVTAFSEIGVEEEVMEAARMIAETDDVEAQRIAFVDVTAAMEAMLDGALESGTIYKQFCPMAFDFEGAYWLSNSKEIYNPYFGDKMLRCGKVDSEIK